MDRQDAPCDACNGTGLTGVAPTQKICTPCTGRGLKTVYTESNTEKEHGPHEEARQNDEENLKGLPYLVRFLRFIGLLVD